MWWAGTVDTMRLRPGTRLASASTSSARSATRCVQRFGAPVEPEVVTVRRSGFEPQDASTMSSQSPRLGRATR